ncbi:MAG: 5-(carboxyamino)imidazole ribonucleotide mutase [Nitrospinae bacterium]|nr:5-(carboxyamino)imidazole ribonucleotide mutase [Nitrospinota bacterium]
MPLLMVVTILMGSQSDKAVMEKTAAILKEFGVPFEIHVASAHRSPQKVRRIIEESVKGGTRIFIAAAGLAAHLAGMVAAHTDKPVIGVPMGGGSLNGMDALLSTVQMPGGVPVASMAIGEAGAKNAAFMAIRILALTDENLAEKHRAYLKNQAGS